MNFFGLKRIVYGLVFLLILILGGLSFLFFEYREISNVLSSVDELIKQEEYSKSLNILDNLKDEWSVENLGILKNKIKNKNFQIVKKREDKSEFKLGKAYLENENWKKAKELFSRVSSSSQYYDRAKDHLDRAETEMIVGRAFERLKEDFKQGLEELRKETEEAREKDNVSLAVARWSNFVVPVKCYWSFFDGDLEVDKKGSGTIVASKDGLIEVLTNRHVVNYEGHLPDNCEINFPGSDKVVDLSESEVAYFLSESEDDWASINLRSLPTEVFNKVKDYVESFDPFENICSVEINSGDKIVILGYPSIGSGEKITATTGIVSSQEDKFYVTDAKIDEGNSGGAAVLLKRNCLLGIPTYVKKGSAESLGRILDAGVILDRSEELKDD